MEYKRGMHVYAEYPRFIKIEPVHGCNRACDFCTLRNKKKEGIHLLDYDVYAKEFLPSVDKEKVKQFSFALHGEPTLHPKILEIVKDTKEAFPKANLLMITNGDIFIHKNNSFELLLQLFDAGLTSVQLDLYDDLSEEKGFELLRKHKEDFYSRSILVKNYYEEKCTMWSSAKSTKELYFVTESGGINTKNSNTRIFDTQGTSVPFEVWEKYGLNLESFPRLATCKELNKYMAIQWNGVVKVCCSDGSGISHIGNAFERRLEELWTSEKADRIRHALSNGRRDIVPCCYACSRRSFRDGLWPHFGKEYDLIETASILAEDIVSDSTYSENLRSLHSKYPIANRFIRRKLNLEEL